MTEQIRTRPLVSFDAPRLREILAMPEVGRWWHPPAAGFPLDDFSAAVRLVIEVHGVVAGMIQFTEELDPFFRHASIDVFLAPQFHGRGLGTEVVRQTTEYLLNERGHHRITIDPASTNLAAIRAYEKAGFQPVGVMHAYERDPGGDGWLDGLLMERVVQPEPPNSAEG